MNTGPHKKKIREINIYLNSGVKVVNHTDTLVHLAILMGITTSCLSAIDIYKKEVDDLRTKVADLTVANADLHDAVCR